MLDETYGVAFGVRFNPAVPRMEFWTRWGQNRSIHQSENNPVLYSTELDDVLTSEYLYNSQDYRNVALVAGEGEGAERVFVTVEREDETPDVPVPPTSPEPPVTEMCTVTLLVDPEGGGTASGGKTVAAGVHITVTATPSDGFTFTEWRENGIMVSTSKEYTYMVNGDRTLTAVFDAVIPVYTITATVDPSGSGTITGAGQYQEGAIVNIKAMANEGYTFSDWKESDATVHSEPDYTFTAEKDRDLVVTLAEKKPSRLPAGYTEVEYIQSSGTQYIDTGRKPIASTTLTMDVEPTAAATSTAAYFYNSHIFSSGSVGYFFRCTWSTSGVRCNKGYTTQTSISYITLSSSTALRRMTIVEDHKTMKAYIVGETEMNMSGRATSSSMPSIKLLSAGTAGINAKLYSCTIEDANGSMEFVPCTNPSGQVGLYDLVGGTFYGNAGTGTFTAGSAV